MSATTEVEPYKGSQEATVQSSPSGSRTRIMENKVEPENCKLTLFSWLLLLYYYSSSILVYFVIWSELSCFSCWILTSVENGMTITLVDPLLLKTAQIGLSDPLFHLLHRFGELVWKDMQSLFDPDRFTLSIKRVWGMRMSFTLDLTAICETICFINEELLCFCHLCESKCLDFF